MTSSRALYKRDWTPTPAAVAYRDLVYRQWWTDWQGHADATGRCEVRAFFGKHRVTAGGREVMAQLTSEQKTRMLSLPPDLPEKP